MADNWRRHARHRVAAPRVGDTSDFVAQNEYESTRRALTSLRRDGVLVSRVNPNRSIGYRLSDAFLAQLRGGSH